MTSHAHRLLAGAFAGGPWTVAHLVRRGERVIGDRPRWLERLARRLVRRWPRGLAVDALAVELSEDAALGAALAALDPWGLEIWRPWERDPRLGPLARAFLGGPWERRALQARGEAVLGAQGVLAAFCRRLVRRLPDGAGLAPVDLEAWLEADLPLLAVLDAVRPRRPRAHWFPAEAMEPCRIPGVDGLPELVTSGDLAAWLGWTPGVLEGHADRAHWHRMQPAFRDYLYRWRGERLIEAPKDRLKRAQRRILRDILERVPVHPAAHGFVKGRSVRTHSALHSGAAVVLRVDLRAFFASVRACRVVGLFRALGFREPVAVDLAGLTTTWTPSDIARHPPWNAPHLPQGAPTSPMLANLVAHALDRRLAGLAARHGATYSRYADDLTFSGERLGPAFLRHVESIVSDEGFAVRADKTLWMRRSVRQTVTGVVVNTHPAVPRAVRERVRAVLHRVETRGWDAVELDTPDPRAWLLGQIAWIRSVRPEHGDRLRERFDRLADGRG